METMALWMAAAILWNLYRYINEDHRDSLFLKACLLYFGVCFVHERYMALFPLLILALIAVRCRRPVCIVGAVGASGWFSSSGPLPSVRCFRQEREALRCRNIKYPSGHWLCLQSGSLHFRDQCGTGALKRLPLGPEPFLG